MPEITRRLDRAELGKRIERAEKRLQKGKTAEALEEYLLVLKDDPENDVVRQLTADLCLSLSRNAEAVKLLMLFQNLALIEKPKGFVEEHAKGDQAGRLILFADATRDDSDTDLRVWVSQAGHAVNGSCRRHQLQFDPCSCKRLPVSLPQFGAETSLGVNSHRYRTWWCRAQQCKCQPNSNRCERQGNDRTDR